jgi:hypothetical protein
VAEQPGRQGELEEMLEWDLETEALPELALTLIGVEHVAVQLDMLSWAAEQKWFVEG